MLTQASVARVAGLLVCASFIGASCGQTSLGLMSFAINDPGNLTLRRSILAFGAGNVCSQVTTRSLPIRLHDEEPIVGRFYPKACTSRVLGNENLFVQFGGFGYAWTNVSQRVGFESSGGLEYDHDFLLDGSTMYVYLRERSVTGSTFNTRLVEQQQAAFIGGLLGGGGRSLTDAFGADLMASQFARGLTLVRAADGSTQLTTGLVPRGSQANAPFRSRGRPLLVNERSEVHSKQRDFVGPIQVESDATLGILAAVDAAPTIDLLLMPSALAEPWLMTYVTQAATTPPPGPPLLDETVTTGQLWTRQIRVPRGIYFLVLDNTDTAGRSAPDGRTGAAVVSYAVELL